MELDNGIEMEEHQILKVMRLEIHDLEINAGISDSEFDFDVPAGAKILDV